MDERDIIDDILDNFDFEKVHETMSLLGWCWNREEYGVPSIIALRKEARKLMNSCLGHKEFYTSCGGLHVQKETIDDIPFYRLMFVVTEGDNYE